jgi:asparagine synthase (glutamine-hydrolysing)
VLRDFARRRLPAAIVTRPKRGFPVPVYGWLSTTLKKFAEETVLDPSAHLAGWFKSAALRELVTRGSAPDAPAHDRHRLWHLIVLEQWFRAWTP